jgi:hypothetical protein
MTLVAVTVLKIPSALVSVMSSPPAATLVTTKMCIGDNVLTARSVATQCGNIEVVSRLQVLTRSSPEDKEALVETLRELGEIVGITGDGTNDGPAPGPTCGFHSLCHAPKVQYTSNKTIPPSGFPSWSAWTTWDSPRCSPPVLSRIKVHHGRERLDDPPVKPPSTHDQGLAH